jgi:hypothetical protein
VATSPKHWHEALELVCGKQWPGKSTSFGQKSVCRFYLSFVLGYVVFHHFKDSWSSSNHSRQPLLLQELGLPAYLLLILFLFPSRRPKIRGSPVGKRQKRSNQVALGPNLTTFSNFDQRKENFAPHGGNQRHKSSSLSRPTFRPSCTLRTISQKPASVQTQSAVKESQDLAITSNAFPQKNIPVSFDSNIPPA